MKSRLIVLAFLLLWVNCGGGESSTTCDGEDCCGNGQIDPGESCDDGAANGSLESNCNELCILTSCGDGVVDPGESCDDGAANGTSASNCSEACVLTSCGDGVVDPGEECDDGDQNSDSAPDACRTNCLAAQCGDGVEDTGEECDDGDSSDENDCLTSCDINMCGDGFLNVGVEECDLGGQNSDSVPDACRLDCTPAACGDAVQDTGEDCDDANGTNGDGCNNDCVTSGKLLWARPATGGESAIAVAITLQGNVVVAGYSGDSLWLRAYDSDGTVLWSVIQTSSMGERAEAVVIDSVDNIIITGRVANPLGQFFVRKFDSTGQLLWHKTYTATSGSWGYAVAVDSADNVIVAGFESPSNGTYKAFIRKYDPLGEILWTNKVSDRFAYSIAVDTSDNIIVGGMRYFSTFDWDVWIQKFNSAGQSQWSKSFDLGAGFERFSGLALSGSDNVIALYHSDSSSSPVWMRQYDAAGDTVWTEIDASLFFRAGSLTLDGDANVIITGRLVGAPPNSTAWIRKYDPQRQSLWETQFPPNGILAVTIVNDVAVSATGHIYIVGSLPTIDQVDSAIIYKLAP